VSFTLAFALQPRKKRGKTSVKVRKTSVRVRKPQSEYSIHITKTPTHYKTYEDGTECSEKSAYKIQTPGNHPEESIQISEHGESLK